MGHGELFAAFGLEAAAPTIMLARERPKQVGELTGPHVEGPTVVARAAELPL